MKQIKWTLFSLFGLQLKITKAQLEFILKMELSKSFGAEQPLAKIKSQSL
jgi:hypothetical protein